MQFMIFTLAIITPLLVQGCHKGQFQLLNQCLDQCPDSFTYSQSECICEGVIMDGHCQIDCPNHIKLAIGQNIVCLQSQQDLTEYEIQGCNDPSQNIFKLDSNLMVQTCTAACPLFHQYEQFQDIRACVPFTAVDRCIIRDDQQCLLCKKDYDLKDGACFKSQSPIQSTPRRHLQSQGCQISNGIICNQCASGYINFLGFCIPQLISPCMFPCTSCSDDQQSCLECSYGWEVNPSTGKCGFSLIPSCLLFCDQCDPVTKECIQCKQGFWKTTTGSGAPICAPSQFQLPGMCSPFCQECGSSPNTCTKCYPFFSLSSDGKCSIQQSYSLNCYYGCSQCSLDGTRCQECQSGFTLSSGICVPLSYKTALKTQIFNQCNYFCRECSSDGGTCRKCAAGYVKDDKGICKPVLTSKYACNNMCEKCEEGGDRCEICERGLQLTETGHCVVSGCSFFCKECAPGGNGCLVCAEGFQHTTPQTGFCVPQEEIDVCDPTVCYRCANDGTYCYTCRNPYVFDQLKNICTLSQCDFYCKTCETDGLTCKDCEEGFLPSLDNGYCEPNFQKAVSTTSCGLYCDYCKNGVCRSCLKGFILTAERKCQISSCAFNCLYCSKDGSECVSCVSGFSLDRDGLCMPTHANQVMMTQSGCNNQCKTCASDGFTCLDCYETFYLDDSGKCRANQCSILCHKCKRDGKTCHKCVKGFIPGEHFCQPEWLPIESYECPLGCEECDSPSNCLKCEEPFFLQEGQCFCAADIKASFDQVQEKITLYTEQSTLNLQQIPPEYQGIQQISITQFCQQLFQNIGKFGSEFACTLFQHSESVSLDILLGQDNSFNLGDSLRLTPDSFFMQGCPLPIQEEIITSHPTAISNSQIKIKTEQPQQYECTDIVIDSQVFLYQSDNAFVQWEIMNIEPFPDLSIFESLQAQISNANEFQLERVSISSEGLSRDPNTQIQLKAKLLNKETYQLVSESIKTIILRQGVYMSIGGLPSEVHVVPAIEYKITPQVWVPLCAASQGETSPPTYNCVILGETIPDCIIPTKFLNQNQDFPVDVVIQWNTLTQVQSIRVYVTDYPEKAQILGGTRRTHQVTSGLQINISPTIFKPAKYFPCEWKEECLVRNKQCIFEVSENGLYMLPDWSLVISPNRYYEHNIVKLTLQCYDPETDNGNGEQVYFGDSLELFTDYSALMPFLTVGSDGFLRSEEDSLVTCALEDYQSFQEYGFKWEVFDAKSLRNVTGIEVVMEGQHFQQIKIKKDQLEQMNSYTIKCEVEELYESNGEVKEGWVTHTAYPQGNQFEFDFKVKPKLGILHQTEFTLSWTNPNLAEPILCSIGYEDGESNFITLQDFGYQRTYKFIPFEDTRALVTECRSAKGDQRLQKQTITLQNPDETILKSQAERFATQMHVEPVRSLNLLSVVHSNPDVFSAENKATWLESSMDVLENNQDSLQEGLKFKQLQYTLDLVDGIQTQEWELFNRVSLLANQIRKNTDIPIPRRNLFSISNLVSQFQSSQSSSLSNLKTGIFDKILSKVSQFKETQTSMIHPIIEQSTQSIQQIFNQRTDPNLNVVQQFTNSVMATEVFNNQQAAQGVIQMIPIRTGFGRRLNEGEQELKHIKIIYPSVDVQQCFKTQVFMTDMERTYASLISPVLFVKMSECRFYGQDLNDNPLELKKNLAIEFEHEEIDPATSTCVMLGPRSLVEIKSTVQKGKISCELFDKVKYYAVENKLIYEPQVVVIEEPIPIDIGTRHYYDLIISFFIGVLIVLKYLIKIQEYETFFKFHIFVVDFRSKTNLSLSISLFSGQAIIGFVMALTPLFYLSILIAIVMMQFPTLGVQYWNKKKDVKAKRKLGVQVGIILVIILLILLLEFVFLQPIDFQWLVGTLIVTLSHLCIVECIKALLISRQYIKKIEETVKQEEIEADQIDIDVANESECVAEDFDEDTCKQGMEEYEEEEYKVYKTRGISADDKMETEFVEGPGESNRLAQVIGAERSKTLRSPYFNRERLYSNTSRRQETMPGADETIPEEF